MTTHDIDDTVTKHDDGTIDIGILTACDGSYGWFSDYSNAGADLPLLQRGERSQGKRPRTA